MNKKLTKTIFTDKVRINAKTEIPNKTTIAAIKEGKKTSRNRKIKGYTNIDELMAVPEA